MKVVLSFLIVTMSFAAMATDVTGRLEIRDTATSSNTCGSIGGCGAQTQLLYGLGATVPFSIGTGWDFVTGGMLRERGVQTSTSGVQSNINMWYLDIPLGIQYDISDFGIRLAVDLGFKLTSSYTPANNGAFTDVSMITPIELGFDYRITPTWLVNLTYETGATVASGNNGVSGASYASVITLGGGYTF